jgi:diacylglycerol kinase (ATP)
MMGRIASPRLQISADDYSWDGPITLAAISNGPWVGGMFHIAPMASNADNIMDLLIVKPVTRRRILTLLPKLMSGEHMQEPEIVHQTVTTLSIKAEQPIPSHLDGEVQSLQTDFKLAVLPGALDLL